MWLRRELPVMVARSQPWAKGRWLKQVSHGRWLKQVSQVSHGLLNLDIGSVGPELSF